MLKVRVIPTLLWKQFGLVKGVRFNSRRRVGSALPAMRVYTQREVDELILLDVAAQQLGNGPDFELIEELGQECRVPFTAGGGICDIAQADEIMRIGADKISINSASYTNPMLVTDIARRYGAQCIVASVDVRGSPMGGWECFSHCGSRWTGRKVVDWVTQLEDLGAGEILITSIDRDGTMTGYDLPLIEAVVHAVNIPVIAAGGAGTYQHMVDAVIQSGASAVAAASMFHFTECTPMGVKHALAAADIPVRWPLSPAAFS